MVTRYRLDLAYDGTDFAGWATQPGLRSVQGVLEDALQTVLRAPEPVRLTVAGRTDAGVHATGQVAHVDLDHKISADTLQHRLRSVLRTSPDVAVHRVTRAPDGFDARFSATGRRYEYRLCDRPDTANPLERHRVVQVKTELDVEAMNAAAATLCGLRDFGAFCKPRPDATTIRDLQEFTWSREGDGTLVATLQADAFCHSMVRALVGATVAVGRGKLSVGELSSIRDLAERTSAFTVMPAHGLCLTTVLYPPDDQLAARAEQTRGRRDLPERADIP